MTTPHQLTQPFDGSGIPPELKALRRWAPWKAVYNAKRGKVDKVPQNAKTPEYGISTASPEKWFTYDEALKAFINAKGMLAGIGLVMTGIEGVAGIDLDNCLDEQGCVAAWAKEVVSTLNSYTEISPSGRGLRVFGVTIADGPDWSNHEVGIEVYVGSTPRFLTVSGRHLPGTPKEMKPIAPGVLAGVRGMYGRAATAAQVARKDLPPIPDVLADLDTPVLADLELPHAVMDFLTTGDHPGDRSRILHSTSVALFSAGLSPQQVLSVLVHNPHSIEVGLDHRRQDMDRATTYMWEHHCVKAQPKARTRALTAAEFDDMSEKLEVPVDTDDDSSDMGNPISASDFEDVSEKGAAPKPAAKKPRFQIYTASAYAQNTKRLEWFIRGVMPMADLSALFGESGSGKTFLAVDMACHIALGLDWFGIPVRRSKVLYVAAEGAAGMRERTRAWCLRHGYPLEDLDGWLYILGDQPNMLEKEDVKALVGCARAACPGVRLIYLDTMAQVTPGANENSGEDMGRFLGHAKALGKALGAHIEMVGHSGKDSNKGLRGWSGIKGALDAEREVIRTKDYRAMCVTKLKDGMGEGREYRFALENVLLDFDLDDGEVSSCVVSHGEMLNESGARDAAAMERKEKAKSARAESPKALGKRHQAVADFLHKESGGRGREFAFEVAVAEVTAHLTQVGGEGVGFTSNEVDSGKATSRVRKEILPAMEKKGILRIADGTLVYLGGIVENPNPQSVQF